MCAWVLRPRFQQRDLGDDLEVEVLEIDVDGRESPVETTHVTRRTATKVWPSEGILEKLVQAQLDQHRRELILDLATLQKADSSGIGEIVAAVHRANLSGGSLLLVNLPARTQEVFQRTELDRLMPIFQTVGEARRHLDS